MITRIFFALGVAFVPPLAIAQVATTVATQTPREGWGWGVWLAIAALLILVIIIISRMMQSK